MIKYFTDLFQSVRRWRRQPSLQDIIRAEIDQRVQEIVSVLVDTNHAAVGKKLSIGNFASRKKFAASPVNTDKLRKKLTGNREQAYTVLDAMMQPVFRTNISLSSGKSYTLVGSPYNYEQIDTYYGVESYFSRSIMRQVETLMRNGFYIVSEETKYGRVVREKLTLMQIRTTKSLSSLISAMIIDLLKYGFFVVEKVWGSLENSRGIVDLRVISPKRVMFVVDDNSTPVGLYLNDTNSIIPKKVSSGIRNLNEFIIGFIAEPGEDVYPAPPCLQIIDDILTLRSFEETVEMLSFQYSSPLLHAKVGTPEQPPRRGEREQVASSIAEMAPNGVIVTDYRVSIESVRLQSGISNLVPYIEHFKDRIFIGSGTSGVIVGEGDTANRATSESHDNSLADRCSYIATIIENALTFQLIADILKAAGAPLVDDEGNPLVTFEFNEVTLSKMIERANNTINLYQSNLITQAEARKVLKKHPMSDAEAEDTYLNRVQIPLALVKATPKDFNRTLVQPENQYGKKGAPGSRKD